MSREIDDDLEGVAHEIWAAAQLHPEEGIYDGVMRVKCILERVLDEPPEYVSWDGSCEEVGDIPKDLTISTFVEVVCTHGFREFGYCKDLNWTWSDEPFDQFNIVKYRIVKKGTE